MIVMLIRIRYVLLTILNLFLSHAKLNATEWYRNKAAKFL